MRPDIRFSLVLRGAFGKTYVSICNYFSWGKTCWFYRASQKRPRKCL